MSDLLLAIDIGNTNTVLGLYDGRNGVAQWRIATRRDRTSDEYAVVVMQLLSLSGYRPAMIAAVIASSVVPQVNQPLRDMVEQYFALKLRFVHDDLPVGLAVTLDNPREVGADRLVNAVAAQLRHAPPLIIIDFGTATTFDIVDSQGRYCGGVIAPGVNLSVEALNRAAAKLPRIAVERPQRVIGTGTVSAMQSGVFWGYVGLIEGLVTRIKNEFAAPMAVIATGGLSRLFGGASGLIEHIDPDLTMTGLVEIYHQQRAAAPPRAADAAVGAPNTTHGHAHISPLTFDQDGKDV